MSQISQAAGKTSRLARWILLGLIGLLLSCSGFPILPGGEKQTLPAQTAIPAKTTAPLNPAETPTTGDATPDPAITTLTIWLPPQFDPEGSSPAAALLKARLEQFALENPQVHLQVRIKAEQGAGGLLDMLTTASAAAPLSLPDLVALPRSLLEPAVLKGYLYPYNGLSSALDAPDWYDFSRQLARFQESVYGIPFAADVLVLASHSLANERPPADWAQTLSISSTLGFAAAEPEAQFTLALYQASGGAILDAQGRPYLDETILAQVLQFYAQAAQAGRIPYWLSQFQSEQQVWDAFLSGQLHSAVVHYSRIASLVSQPDYAVAFSHLPTSDGQRYTLASGWVWAMANPAPDRQALAARLVEYLTESTFMAAWSAAAGYLPARAAALSAWPDNPQRLLAVDLLLSARMRPSTGVVSVIGPVFNQATLLVLRQQMSPDEAAKTAVKPLNSP